MPDAEQGERDDGAERQGPGADSAVGREELEDLDTLYTTFPDLPEVHVSPSVYRYMTLREIRDAVEVLQIYWISHILADPDRWGEAEHCLVRLLTRIGYLLSVAGPADLFDDVQVLARLHVHHPSAPGSGCVYHVRAGARPP